MTGSLTQWPDGLAAQAPPAQLHGADHVSRQLLARLLDADPRDDETAVHALRQEYDRQAADWDAWTGQQSDYARPLEDLLGRRPQVVAADDVVLEVGVGTSSTMARSRVPCRSLVVLDISWEMVRRVDRALPRVQADVRHLPLRRAAVDVVVGLNAVPCWTEFRRVLRPGGRLLWLSSFGLDTPIVVPPDQVAEGLAEARITWARAGHGFWLVAEEIACTG